MSPSSPQKPRALLRRPGFWILLFLLLACGFLLAGSLLRPWRILQAFPLEGEGWRPGLASWEAGPLASRGPAGELRVQGLSLPVDPLALLGLRAFPELGIEGLFVRLEGSGRARQLAYQRLRPGSLPLQQILLEQATVEIPAGNSSVTLRLTAEGRRNQAGTLEATGRLQGGGLRGPFFARLGWDALEEVASFRGELGPRPFFPLLARMAPFLESVLRSRGEESFPLEATLYLDAQWRLSEAVLLLGNAPGHPPLAGVLEGHPAEGFPYRLAWEYGPRRPEWQAEARGIMGGPVALRIRAGRTGGLWHFDAPDGWYEGATARLSRNQGQGETLWQGILEQQSPGTWEFLGSGSSPFAEPLPDWPRFLAFRGEAS
jgi:hypothetical protein